MHPKKLVTCGEFYYLITNDRKKIVEYADRLNYTLENNSIDVSIIPTERIIVGECKEIKQVGNKIRKSKQFNLRASNNENKKLNYGEFKRDIDRCEQKFQSIGNIAGAISSAIQIVLVVFQLPEAALYVEFAKYLIQAYIDMTSK